jgi:hypothetical protein
MTDLSEEMLFHPTLQKVVDYMRMSQSTVDDKVKVQNLEKALYHLVIWAVAAEKRLPMFPGMGI